MNILSEYNPIGIDISEFSLRLVQIRKRGKRNVIIAENELPLPKDTIVDGNITNEELFINTIRKLVKTARGEKITSRRVVAVLPEAKSFLKIIKVKKDEKLEFEKVLEKEIPKNIPLTIEEIYYDWQIIDQHDNGDSSVLIGVAPRKTVDHYVQAIFNANLFPYVMEIEGASIARCLFEKSDVSGPKIIIDIGAARTSLILYDKGVVQFTISLPISGSNITNIISEKLKLSKSQAEKAKKVCGLDKNKCEGSLRRILFNNVNELASKINESIDFYNDYFGNENPIQQVILTGGGANFLKIDSVLSEKLKLPVIQSNPLTNIDKVSRGVNIPNNKLRSYSTAIGLALRGAVSK